MSIFHENLKDIEKVSFVDWDRLQNKTIFISGATGLIGTTFINMLNYANKSKDLNVKVIALVRDLKKAQDRFKEIDQAALQFVLGSVEKLPEVDEDIDFIIHGASQTASKEFVEHAVETINTSVNGTMNMLNFAMKKDVKSFVYLSSMEVYGYPQKGHKVKENEIGFFSPLNLRNSYPIGKIMCESLCCAFAKEYQIPVKIIRLAQTYGPGTHCNDNRVFAYFNKCVKENKDIVLKTEGKSERCYLLSFDAVTAILTIMLKGKNGLAYNAADEKTYCSIAEMAERVAAEGGIKVKYDIQSPAVNGFPETTYMNLDTTALRELGWNPMG